MTEPVDLSRTAARTAGVLWHTADGGRTWKPARLPTNFDYQLPTFFNPRDGVVLDDDATSRSGRGATVFVTADGGRTWRARPVPDDPNLRTYGGLDLPAQRLPFSAASMTKWALFVGPALYTTGNGGRSWHRLATTPRWPPGWVKSLHLGLTGSGWALAGYAGPDCWTGPGCEHDRRQSLPGTGGRCGPTSERCRNQTVQQALLSTTDGGRTWRPLPFSPSPP